MKMTSSIYFIFNFNFFLQQNKKPTYKHQIHRDKIQNDWKDKKQLEWMIPPSDVIDLQSYSQNISGVNKHVISRNQYFFFIQHIIICQHNDSRFNHMIESALWMIIFSLYRNLLSILWPLYLPIFRFAFIETFLLIFEYYYV